MRPIPTHDRPLIFKAIVNRQLNIPFFSSLIRAGFPSPAENYVERVCDLNDLCITNPESTYFVRVDGDSMIGAHIEAGDVLIVDSSLEPVEGRTVVVWYNGEHTVKQIHYAKPLVVLMPANPKYEPIYVQPGDDFRIFGVVKFNLKNMLK